MRVRWVYRVVFLTLTAVIAGWIFAAGNVKLPGFITAVQLALWRPTGSAQLVYYDPLPAEVMDDDKCEGPPVGVGAALAADPLKDGAGPDASGKTCAHDPRPLSLF